MNGITTILPFRLESRICLPDGSTKVNSGDLRGTGGVAKAETVSATNAVAAKARIRFRIGPVYLRPSIDWTDVPDKRIVKRPESPVPDSSVGVADVTSIFFHFPLRTRWESSKYV